MELNGKHDENHKVMKILTCLVSDHQRRGGAVVAMRDDRDVINSSFSQLRESVVELVICLRDINSLGS